MRITSTLTSLTLLMSVGCSTQSAIDLDAERNALMDADRAWFQAYSSSDNPADVFVAQFGDDGSLLPPDAPLAHGKEAVHAVVSELEAMPGFSVTWSPDAADVGSGGDLGYTMGSYEMTMDGPDGPMTIAGKYITVWKKRSDGTWMVTADMFNADAPPTPHM